MTQENLTFYTLNNTYTTIPLKQKIYIFSENDTDFHKTARNPERTKRKSKIQVEMQTSTKLHNVWKPRIPSKKLFDEPKFFLSLERKKFRIINGIKNMSMLCERQPCESVLRGKKVKQGSMSMRRMSSSLEPAEMASESSRKGWEPNNKTPYLNFNMQYLIKKRKSMTPTLYHGFDKLSKAASTICK